MAELRSAAALPRHAPEKSTPERGAWATHAGLVIVQIAFATQAVEAKVVMMPRALGGEAVGAETLAMMRMLGGALFFQALVQVRMPSAARLKTVDHAKLAGLSLLGIVLNQVLFLMGLKWSTPFSVSVLGATIPIFAAALAVIFGRERFSWRTALGLALALVGVLSLIGPGSLNRGAILVALNSLSYALYVVLSREVIVRVGALRTVAWLFTYGAILFAPLGAMPLLAELSTLTPRAWGYAAYIVAVPTIVAYVLNAWALARSSATLVTVYIYLQPLLAAVLAWIQLGLGISSRAAVAAVFILVGLGVVASRQPARAAP